MSEVNLEDAIKRFNSAGVKCSELGSVGGKSVQISIGSLKLNEKLSELSRTWFYPSYVFDCEQAEPALARERYDNFNKTPLQFSFPSSFDPDSLGVNILRKEPGDVQAAIVREKGTNGDREMAFSLHAAGFAVKDITMTDLMSGREDLSDVRFVVFPGGFSNSDVLGGARGWAGAFRANERARDSLVNFLAREDVLSLGVCNGCQLLTSLDELSPFPGVKMLANKSGKFESSFLSVDLEKSSSVMLSGLEGSRLGIWVAHGEGQFAFDGTEKCERAIRYSHSTYPANPNGSMKDTAGIVSSDGRHLAMMPHLERSIFSWQWGYYPLESESPHLTPWVLAFVNAYRFLKG